MRKSKKGSLTQFTPMLHQTMDCAAWIALSHSAKALYPFIKRRAGYSGNNNGSALCSVREAAAYLGMHKDTATKALQDLQRKGFIVAVSVGCLGVTGEGKATTWRITELGTPTNTLPSKDYTKWSEGNNFPVAEGRRLRSGIA